TSGEGGMVLTNDEQLAQRCRDLRNLCFDKERRFIHQELGWNFRMSNVQAAVGVAQLERIPEALSKKRAIGRWQPVLPERGLFTDQRCLHAERIACRGLYLPSGVGLTQDEADASAQALRECLV